MSLSVSSRRKPYPYDLYANNEPYMLLTDKTGKPMMGRKSQPLEADPITYEYGSTNPFSERAYPFVGLTHGFGQHRQNPGRARRIYFALNGDNSINGKWQIGPHFTTETIYAGQPVRGVFRALHSGGDATFAIAGDKVRRRVSENSWTDSLTHASGGQYNQWTRFKYRGSASEHLYVVATAGNVSRYNGSTWYTFSGSEGPEDRRAEFIEHVGDSLIVGWDNKIQAVEADPQISSNWAGSIFIGDGRSDITWLRQVGNKLIIFKADGVYTVSPQGLDQELFPFLRSHPDNNNGRNANVWMDQMFVPWGDTFYRLLEDGKLDTAGAEQLLENGSEVRGLFVDSAGHNTWYNYEVLYNPDTNKSYLCKYGSWYEDEDGSLTQFIGVHNGALKVFNNKQAVSLNVVPQGGVNNDRLYVGFADGTAEWCILPRQSPNPSEDPACQPNAIDTCEFYLPIHHANFQSDSKSFRGFAVFGPKLDASNYVQIQYRTDPTSSFTYITTPDSTGALVPAKYTLSGQRIDFPEEVKVQGRQIEIKVILVKGPTSGSEETPVIDGIILHEQVRPALRLEYEFVVNAGNLVARHDGGVLRRTASQLQQALQEAAGAIGTVPILLPTENTIQCSFVDYEEAYKPYETRYGVEWGVTLRGIQFVAVSDTGSHEALGGLSYGTMEQYTYGELETIL
jgi:hypothetical protein